MSLSRLFACSAAGLGLSLLAGLNHSVLAQSESFLWGPGSNVGPSTTIEPKNCVTAAVCSITCDTQIVNPPGDTPAKPQYRPFSN